MSGWGGYCEEQVPTELVSVEIELEDAESHELRTVHLSFSIYQSPHDVSSPPLPCCEGGRLRVTP